MRKLLLTILSIVMCLSLAVEASALEATLNIQAEVVEACSMSVNSINFGVYSGTAIFADGSVVVQCSEGVIYTVSYDQGENYTTTRRMKHGTSDYVSYGISCGDYAGDATHHVCGDGTVGDTSSDTGDGTLQTFPVAGVMAGSQFKPSGIYTDNVLVTVSW